MKNYSNILLSLGVTLFLLTVGMKSEVEAQCSSPWQTTSEIVTVGSCTYLVDLCILCQFSYPGKIKVNSFRNISGCTDTLDYGEITQQIFTQLSNPTSIWLNFCQDTFPPCKNTPRKVYEFETPICWKLVLDNINGTDSTWLALPCDYDAYCYEEHKYCKDKYGVIHHTNGSFFGYNFPPECKLEGHEIIKPIFLHEESECYIMHTICNP